MSSAAELRSLFRAFLRGGHHFPNYNMKEYILRRARDGFREGAAETDPSKLSSLVAHAQEELITLKRQSLVYGLYARPIRNILEIEEVAAQAKRV